MNLGHYISNYCSENSMSIADFAKKSGISRSYIFMIKNASRTPSISILMKAADTMGMSIEELTNAIDFKVSFPKIENVSQIPLYKELPLSDASDYIPASVDNPNAYFAFKTKGLFPFTEHEAIAIVRLSRKVSNDKLVFGTYDGRVVFRKYYVEDKSVSLISLNPEESVIRSAKNPQGQGKYFNLYGEVVEIRYLF